MSRLFSSLAVVATLIAYALAQDICVNPPLTGTVYVQPVVTVCPIYINYVVTANTALVISEGITININNAPTTLNLITSASVTTSSTITVSTTTTTTAVTTVTAAPSQLTTPFALAIGASTAAKVRRQANGPSYLDASGAETSTCNPSTGVFSFSNGQLQISAGGSSFFATNGSTAFEPFDITPLGPGYISSTFAVQAGALIWQNALFDNGEARFCVLNEEVNVVFHGDLPTGCEEVLLSAIPPSICSGSSSSASPSTLSTSTTSSQTSSASSSSSSGTPVPTKEPWPGHSVIAYYNSGERDQAIYPPEKIPWQYLTHLCYAFAPTTANYTVTYNATLLSLLSTAAHETNTKLILSVGGYGAGGYYFSDIVQNNITIGIFVADLLKIVTQYDLDGIDIDWEFVGDTQPVSDPKPTNTITRDDDAINYLNLLQALRAAMPNIYISAAVPMFTWASNAGVPDLSEYEPYFDAIHLMAYDLWNGDDTAGSNSALPITAQGPGLDTGNPVINTSEQVNGEPFPNGGAEGQRTGQGGVEAWYAAKIPYEKLVFGTPFYGYGWDLDDPNSPATSGLYSPSGGKSAGDKDENPNGDSGFWRWRNLKAQGVLVQQANGSYTAGPGWQYGYNEATLTPYVWSESRSELISYDDPASLILKRNYAKDTGLAGMMFWAMYGDTDDAELTQVLN